ncbi:hypothetical protein JXQ31_05980 [candidate division KSB1 bacterium]|nr:hypothetical protein [candidate division KSB1 bacterium]
MKKNVLFIFFLISALSISVCTKNFSIDPIYSNSISGFRAITFIYTLFYENNEKNVFKLYINNQNNSSILFPDNEIRSFARISPDGKKIVYIKNQSLHPWYGIVKEGTPALCFTQDMGKTEIVLLNDESINYGSINWINGTQIALSVYKNSEYYFQIINITGVVLLEKKLDSLFKVYVIPNSNYVYLCNNNKFSIINISTSEYREYPVNENIAIYSPPIVVNHKIIIMLMDNTYLKYDLDTHSYETFLTLDYENRLIMMNSNEKVFLQHGEASKLVLYQNDEMQKSITMSTYKCDAGLYLSEDYILYFVGEVGDDEGGFFKADFNTGYITKLTNHDENNFLVDFAFYNFN